MIFVIAKKRAHTLDALAARFAVTSAATCIAICISSLPVRNQETWIVIDEQASS